MGGIPKYSGKDKVMYVTDGVGNKRHELFEKIGSLFSKIGDDRPFKIVYQIQ